MVPDDDTRVSFLLEKDTNMFSPSYEDKYRQEIINHLPNQRTFVDVGANFGTYTVFAAEKVGPRGTVFAIEPSPGIFPLLFESVAMNGFEERTISLRCAAGAKQGEAVLHQFSSRKGGNTMLPHIADFARERYGETVTPAKVATRTLDDILGYHYYTELAHSTGMSVRLARWLMVY